MERRMLGGLWPVSALTIGGGGLGQVWGRTDRTEAVATLRSAVESGIDLVDVAPSYGNGEAESVVGEAFDGRMPDEVRVCTKHHVGDVAPGEVWDRMVAGLEASLERMRLSRVDLFLLHSQIVPERDPERSGWTVTSDLYRDQVRSALDRLVAQGRVGAWGITAVQFPAILDEAFSEQPAPAVAQMIANVLDSPGDMVWSEEPPQPRDLVGLARSHGIGVMGIRAVQAGALTDAIDRELPPDHPATVDFTRAAPFREVAAELGESPAALAHRYALSLFGIDTVVLGVKNRAELAECVAAANRGPLPPDTIALIDHRLDTKY